MADDRWGMNTDQGKALADRLLNTAKDFDEQLKAVTAQLDGTDWTGPDSNNFRNLWATDAVVKVKHVIEMMQATGTKMNGEVQGQIDASA